MIARHPARRDVATPTVLRRPACDYHSAISTASSEPPMDIYDAPIAQRIDGCSTFAARYTETYQPGNLDGRLPTWPCTPADIVALSAWTGASTSRWRPDAASIIPPLPQPGRHVPTGLGTPERGRWPITSCVRPARPADPGPDHLPLFQGRPGRGCAGFNYDTAAAIAHTHAIKTQVEDVFGRATARSIRSSAASRPTRTR